MAQLLVAALIAAWYGRAAQHAARDVLPWAAAGAAIFLALNHALLLGLFAVAESVGVGAGVLLGFAAWIGSIVGALVIGDRILPRRSDEQLSIEIALHQARAAKADSEASDEQLRCERCGRSVTKREALVQGAIRIDDSTCICSSCKGAS